MHQPCCWKQESKCALLIRMVPLSSTMHRFLSFSSTFTSTIEVKKWLRWYQGLPYSKGDWGHTNMSKQAGDLQEGKEFKHFLFCMYRHPSHYIFLDLLHWLKHLLQYWIDVTEYSSLFLTFKGKHLGFLPLKVVWSIWFS